MVRIKIANLDVCSTLQIHRKKEENGVKIDSSFRSGYFGRVKFFRRIGSSSVIYFVTWIRINNYYTIFGHETLFSIQYVIINFELYTYVYVLIEIVILSEPVFSPRESDLVLNGRICVHNYSK